MAKPLSIQAEMLKRLSLVLAVDLPVQNAQSIPHVELKNGLKLVALGYPFEP